MRRMRTAGLSGKTIRNYVGVLRAMYGYAQAKPRRWTTRNPAADVALPKAPTYTDIRYLTPDEVWALVDHAQPGDLLAVDRAMYLTAAMTGLRVGELQALDWRSVDMVHARIRVRRTWDGRAKTFTTRSPDGRSARCRCPTWSPGSSSGSRAPRTPTGPSRRPTRSCSPTRRPASR